MRTAIIASMLLLTGCMTPPVVPDAPVIKYSPDDIDPVSIYVPHFYVVTQENAEQLLKDKKVLIAVSYDDSIELRKSLEDVNSHIKLQNETIKILRK